MLNLACNNIALSSLTFAHQCLSTMQIYSFMFWSICSKPCFFFRTPYSKSIRSKFWSNFRFNVTYILLILFSFVGILEVRKGIPTMQASVVLSLFSVNLKIQELMSHNIKISPYLVSKDNRCVFGFGTVSTWVSSRRCLAIDFLSFSLEFEEIVMIL